MQIKRITFMLTNPIDYLSQVNDPRRQTKNLLHPLKNILTIALTAVICGYHDWVDIEDFGNENQTWFSKFLDLTNGIPSHDTFSNVFKRLNKDELCQYFSAWINDNKLVHPHIAIDGKFVQGGHKSENPLQLVTAFASQTKLNAYHKNNQPVCLG
ncbi:ISAs1 family transposase [Methanobrevibacter sp.]|uniref:ISAs1 family transposase n=1 Tax=Methanobrevibacter sp. TaxID=66852 RepID=UPI002A74A3B9|nr:ISAs1 family transposase [Methanobrevibacter sp.]MDY3096128.1 ISAs1 family transposase [Methanobrevibacter sp.]